MKSLRAMLSRFRTPTPPIGLELGAEALKMIQLTEAGGRLKVAKAVRVPLPDDVKGDPDRRVAFAGAQLRQALRRGGFVGSRVVAAVPKELLHYRTHRLPPIAPDEVPAAARIDARDLFRFDPDSADVQSIDAGEIQPEGGERRREVILIAAGKKYLDDFTLALDAAGAEVVSLDVDPCALWRAARRVPLPHDGGNGGAVMPRVLLDVGAAQSRVIIGTAGVIRFVRTIDATAMAPQALAREALKCVRYHAMTFRGPSPKRIELVGGSANAAEVRSTLATTLLLPAEPAGLFAGIDVSAIPESDRTPGLGGWAVALGLALKGMKVAPALSVASTEGEPSRAALVSGGAA
jgi:type IV pilus assembly protein PilM